MNRQPDLDAGPLHCAYAPRPAQRPHCQLTAVVRYGTMALCGDCDTRRSTVGKATPPRRLPPQDPLDVLSWIARTDQQQRQLETELAAAVRRARAQQHSWSAIGATLNITRQAAQQRFRQDQPEEG